MLRGAPRGAPHGVPQRSVLKVYPKAPIPGAGRIGRRRLRLAGRDQSRRRRNRGASENAGVGQAVDPVPPFAHGDRGASELWPLVTLISPRSDTGVTGGRNQCHWCSQSRRFRPRKSRPARGSSIQITSDVSLSPQPPRISFPRQSLACPARPRTARSGIPDP